MSYHDVLTHSVSSKTHTGLGQTHLQPLVFQTKLVKAYTLYMIICKNFVFLYTEKQVGLYA